MYETNKNENEKPLERFPSCCRVSSGERPASAVVCSLPKREQERMDISKVTRTEQIFFR